MLFHYYCDYDICVCMSELVVVTDTRGTWQTWRMMQILSWCWRSSPGWARPSWELTIWKSEHQLGPLSLFFSLQQSHLLVGLINGLKFDRVVGLLYLISIVISSNTFKYLKNLRESIWAFPITSTYFPTFIY